MTISSQISLRRLKLLFIKDFKEEWKHFSINGAALFSFFFLCFFIAGKTGNLSLNFYNKLFFSGLFFTGTLFASRVFGNAHRKYLNHDWLMLPASTFEKFLEKLILSSIVFAVGFLSVFTLFTVLSTFILGTFFNIGVPLFNPFELYVWKGIGHYIIIHSVFLLGGAWFKTGNFIKTSLLISLLSIFLIFSLFFLSWIFFSKYMNQIQFGDIGPGFEFTKEQIVTNLKFSGKCFIVGVKASYYLLLAPLCWAASFFKLKRVEVKDGV